VWGDATCDVPEWDVNDELERDVMNCQWTARDAVPPDDALRGLAGSLSSPEIARALTLNVYATAPRAYKRRNLQAAARIVAAFASRHPELFAGVSLDPDVYVIPWFQGREWFDYNPGTIRQFRHWLRGTGPYRGDGGDRVPDLSAYRRSRTFTLDEVRAMAGRAFASWDDVDPPRAFPPKGGAGHQDAWRDPWRLVWDQFRRHLVHVHYDELAAWTVEAGIDAGKVFTAQAYTAADSGYLPKASHVEGGATDYDSGGVSVEGAIPKQGRLGVILYGESTSNAARTDTGEPPFRLFERMGDRFGVVELSLASLKDFAYRPGYADGYRAFREITNAGALVVSPMAWNGWNGLFADQPGYQAYTSWRNTPAEDAMLDRMIERANLPASAKLWTFGSPRHRDADGWTAEPPATIAENAGTIEVAGGKRIRLVSPAGLWIRSDRFDTLVAGLPGVPGSSRIVVRGRVDGTTRWITLAAPVALDSLGFTPAGHTVPLSWPRAGTVIDRLAIDIERDEETTALRIDHVALYPREPAR
jgi:hypothetical protein